MNRDRTCGTAARRRAGLGACVATLGVVLGATGIVLSPPAGAASSRARASLMLELRPASVTAGTSTRYVASGEYTATLSELDVFVRAGMAPCPATDAAERAAIEEHRAEQDAELTDQLLTGEHLPAPYSVSGYFLPRSPGTYQLCAYLLAPPSGDPTGQPSDPPVAQGAATLVVHGAGAPAGTSGRGVPTFRVGQELRLRGTPVRCLAFAVERAGPPGVLCFSGSGLLPAAGSEVAYLRPVGRHLDAVLGSAGSTTVQTILRRVGPVRARSVALRSAYFLDSGEMGCWFAEIARFDGGKPAAFCAPATGGLPTDGVNGIAASARLGGLVHFGAHGLVARVDASGAL